MLAEYEQLSVIGTGQSSEHDARETIYNFFNLVPRPLIFLWWGAVNRLRATCAEGAQAENSQAS